MADILIADDHAVVRMAIKLLLESGGHSVVGGAASGLELVELYRKLNPEVVILDIDMPELDGFEVLKRLRRGYDKCKFIVFSGMNSSRFAGRCERAGANGFLSKESDLAELLNTVNLVLSGYNIFPTTKFSDVNFSLEQERHTIEKLSNRELTVLRKLAQGIRIKDISAELLLSEKTISTYKLRISEKLNISNFLELVEFAKRNGIV